MNNKDAQPEANLPASPKPDRSKIGEIQHTRRGVKPERRVGEVKSRPSEIISPSVSPLETATRIAAEFIAEDSLEKTKLAADAEQAKLDLSREKDERLAAAIDAEARLAAVQRDLAEVHDRAAATRKSLSRERKIRVVVGFAAAVLVSGVFLYRSMPGIPDLPARPPPPGPPPRMATLAPESQATLDSPEIRFAEGLDRLNLMLASAGRDPEDTIRSVRTQFSPAVCPFVWRNGQVSLTFNDDMNLTALADIFSRCAEAVAQLP